MSRLPIYPHIIVDLGGAGDNPGAMVECVAQTLKLRTVDQPDIDRFRAEALAGPRDHVLKTIAKWVRVKSADPAERRAHLSVVH